MGPITLLVAVMVVTLHTSKLPLPVLIKRQ